MDESPFVECVRAYVRGNGGFYALVIKEYEPLRDAFMGGKTFYTGESTDGDVVTLKLGEVEAVMHCTPVSQEAAVIRGKAEAKAREPDSFT